MHPLVSIMKQKQMDDVSLNIKSSYPMLSLMIPSHEVFLS